jgi:hypothetical protein
MKNTIRWVSRGCLLAMLLMDLAGCWSRQHLTRSHGASTRAARERQTANPGAGEHRRPVADLDAADAKQVADAYRQGMRPAEGATTADTRLLMVAPARTTQTGSNIPQPSVAPADQASP